MEAYIEFYLFGIFNLYTAEYTLSGELISIMLTYFVHFMIFGVLPTLSLFVISRNIHQLEDPALKECIGEMYEGTRIQTVF